MDMEITEHGGSKRGTGQADKGEIRGMSPAYAVPGLYVRQSEMTPVPDQGRPEPEAPEEHELIDRARRGDREAFNELVRRHRAKVLGLANRLVEDRSLAEDVVQDALIRAFLHLGTLADAGKFGPWLRRIVRNQALLKLRRGGPSGRERPFSSLPDPSAVRTCRDFTAESEGGGNERHCRTGKAVEFHESLSFGEVGALSGSPCENRPWERTAFCRSG
ncbi:RNA polymerase sigma factor [Paenibacillus sp. RC84]|uniref:RNA polymerase sigma factor n=1 Tax=Paenibacillus sp. RC84 TaxID=3156252 RepID=UPI0035199586